MEHISKVKPPKKGAKPKLGYTDIFSSIVLKKNKGFPLTRKLSLPKEPGFLSEKIIIEEVIEESVQKIKEIGLEAILTADRGVASKRLAVKYKGEEKKRGNHRKVTRGNRARFSISALGMGFSFVGQCFFASLAMR